MIDAICAFTRGGVLLWMYQYIKVKGNPVDELIKRVLLEERTAQEVAAARGGTPYTHSHHAIHKIAAQYTPPERTLPGRCNFSPHAFTLSAYAFGFSSSRSERR